MSTVLLLHLTHHTGSHARHTLPSLSELVSLVLALMMLFFPVASYFTVLLSNVQPKEVSLSPSLSVKRNCGLVYYC